MKKYLILLLLSCLGCLGVGIVSVHSEEQSEDVKVAIKKGLQFLANEQSREDGHWERFPGLYPITMTSLAGMALLMEGSTLKEGKYQKNIRWAVDYLISQAKADGRIFNVTETSEYMKGHGYALMFLACAYGEEDDPEQRQKLRVILTRGAQFIRDAQACRVSPRDGKTRIGGWGYVAAREGNNFDVASVPVMQMQALRAARDAGIKTSSEAIKEALAYLADATNADGGVIFSLQGGAGGAGQPSITAGVLMAGLSAGDYDSPTIRKRLQFVEKYYNPRGANGTGYDLYRHYYHAQALYILGDEGYARLMKGAAPKEAKNWSWYKKENLPKMVRSQGSDGRWDEWSSGSIYSTCINLAILQLENGALPLYQRYRTTN